MAYNNTFFYDRDNSVDDKYKYIYDFWYNFDPIYYLQLYPDIAGNAYYSIRPYEHYINFGIKEGRIGSPHSSNLYFPIYGSSVNYVSRLNFMQTIDNSLRAIPASENNLAISYNLKFLLTDNLIGNLLKTIEVAGGVKYLKFPDPSNFYQSFVGYAEKYSINKISSNLSEVNLTINNNTYSPELSWRYSSMYSDPNYKDPDTNDPSAINAARSKHVTNFPETYKGYSASYDKHSIVYNQNTASNLNFKNKIDNFWFAKKYVPANSSAFINTYMDEEYWTKNFYFETKYPFILENEIDVYKVEYKNSFIQNVKYKQNSNTLKQFSLKFENISDNECRAILFFLEKKCGYRRFIYEFPIFMKKDKVFICNQWNHVFKYKNCHDITMQLIEDPNPNITYGGFGTPKPYLL